jgi:hypothetical protein
MKDVIAVLLITTIGNLVIGLAKLIAKSKCSEVSCCGCFIHRDVALEEKENEFEILHTVKNES